MQDAEPTLDDTGVSPELLDALRPYLAESIMVLDRDWTVRANLAPPGGLIGRGLGLGVHTLEDMHPDDALLVMDLGAQAFETEDGWEGSIVVRMHRGDGTFGRYEITAVNRFTDPVIAGMVVRTRELPEEAEDRWPGIESRLAVASLAELLPLGVLLLDADGRVIYANETACGMLGREPEVLKRDGLASCVEDADRATIDDTLARVTHTPGREQVVLRFAGAAIERAECRFWSEGDPEVTCVAMTLEDVTQRWATERALERRANSDDLTGLRNRASLFDHIQERLDAGRPTTVAFLDLDGFKAVNDTHGHARGDRLLVDVAHALRAHLGGAAEIGRIGGDEFVVVTDREAADGLAGRLTAVVAGVSSGGLSVTASAGVAHALPDDSLRDVLHRADEAMYVAKGRRAGAQAPR